MAPSCFSAAVLALLWLARALCAPAAVQSLQETSGPATCWLQGEAHPHGQKVHREDPCELCLCVDGELLCSWQACSEETPCAASQGRTCDNATGSAASSSGRPENYTSAEPTAAPVATSGTTEVPPSAPPACYVMGARYEAGEALPRDTGTCLECVCDVEARVTCSPRDCGASQHDDYRASLDMLDVDTF
ncbi:von Willebrand factor C and EGF domain-containing protein [Bacillus rossius redtenbacheri]|uniref:von Willebrand factor C and EGF domain-containing protein n=1 Tax=Bacillus rossius redtenbacheri TaxID=93214 RepID=UPI002FDE9BAA